MLTALEAGVKGGKWFRLIDKVYALPNLRQAFARVKANQGAAGVDHVTVEEFERDLEPNLEKLSWELADQSYRPHAVRRKWIAKLGSKERRPPGIPTVRADCTCARLAFGMGRNLSSLPSAAGSAI
jgi:RNA-directed DNA polymerase